ncbi:60S RIBOSOMAL PROTEIN L9 [Encephalitozoon cuniculi GB-M1]|uniref:60S RIBOSOMAL PROTEIN L9 n=2 Tax=Encephalitozoon cuniculi TaxID=6035 RepID=Q8SSF7_ENCCU|nr:60S ribosomal protein L9 [Encephalitozoon cuniculi GB-M1]KMV66598.1 ribosomal protein L6 [Encephalitozoon cuniculi EcunIII-L]7QEP_L9 Chain L9, 60S RIBOSOMAL PROTEIN L9 [Encephalitozoon cuniculi GB-M1]CAD25109.2 60S RIBOSOMAL PROTEIN L9 [Encephalitozoon cuniculi GB-M1]
MRILVTRIVKVPEDCTATQEGKIFTFQGPKGSIVEDCTRHPLTFDIHEGNIRIRLWNGKRKAMALAITVESLLRNAIKAVTVGFAYTMKAVYNHFSINMEIKEDGKILLVKNFLGEKNVKRFRMRGAARVRLDERKDTIVIEGPSLSDVSQSAGTITNECKAKNRDSRVFLDGIFVTERGIMA